MVMAQSLFLRLKQKDSACNIDVVAPGWSLPILERMPQVRNGIELAIAHGEFGWGKRKGIGYALRENKYDQAIVLPGSWKSALIPYFAGIPRRTGFRGEWRYQLLNDIRPLDERVLKRTVERFVALAEGRPVTAPPEILPPFLHSERALGHRMAMQLGLDAPQMAVGMMPGAEYGPAKQWPLEHFGALAKLLARAGEHTS